MSSLFYSHLNFFSLSTSFLYCNTGRGEMSSFFLFFIWYGSCKQHSVDVRGWFGMFFAMRGVLGIVRGSQAAEWAVKHNCTTSRFILHLIWPPPQTHFFFHFSVSFGQFFLSGNLFENYIMYAGYFFHFFLIIWLRGIPVFIFFQFFFFIFPAYRLWYYLKCSIHLFLYHILHYSPWVILHLMVVYFLFFHISHSSFSCFVVILPNILLHLFLYERKNLSFSLCSFTLSIIIVLVSFLFLFYVI